MTSKALETGFQQKSREMMHQLRKSCHLKIFCKMGPKKERSLIDEERHRRKENGIG
jgi:hypothetical protein